jgi:hypothetical protein
MELGNISFNFFPDLEVLEQEAPVILNRKYLQVKKKQRK